MVPPRPLTSGGAVSEMLDTVEDDLKSVSAASFAPSVQGAAQAFLTHWQALVGQTQEMTTTTITSLLFVDSNYKATDSEASMQIKQLKLPRPAR